MKKLHKPGEDNQKSGKYIETGPKGGKITKPRKIEINSGDRLPPTQRSGNTWKHK